jgi:hypothetical protein
MGVIGVKYMRSLAFTPTPLFPPGAHQIHVRPFGGTNTR